MENLKKATGVFIWLVLRVMLSLCIATTGVLVSLCAVLVFFWVSTSAEINIDQTFIIFPSVIVGIVTSLYVLIACIKNGWYDY